MGIGAPRCADNRGRRLRGAVPLLDFFDRRGASLVAGRAALLPAGADPNGSVANAAQAGAVAVLFYGADLPAGGIGLDESAPIPAVSVPEDVAQTLLARIRSGIPATVSLGAVRTESNTGEGRVMRFSSTGLAFDGRVKPEVVAPGVALETAEPGANADGSARYGTVNGTSGAAALVAGAAALLAQARPYLDADALKSLLVGAARPLPDDPRHRAGRGADRSRGCDGDRGRREPGVACTRPRRQQTLAHRPGVRPAQRLLPPADSVARRTRRRRGGGSVEFDVRPQRMSRWAGTLDPRARARTS